MSDSTERRSLSTPMSRVLGSGSARDGVHHWWTQRVTSVALVPLTILFIIPFATTLGDGYDAMRAVYASPFNAIVAILFVAVAFHHLMQGMQVVIEDYVHARGWRTTLLLLNTLVSAAAGAAAVFSIVKIAIGA